MRNRTHSIRKMAFMMFLMLLFFPTMIFAQGENSIEVHGFFLGALTGRISGERPALGEQSDYVLGEERLRLDISGASENAAFLTKGDLFHDAITNEIHVDLREGYVGYRTGPLDFRLGRQIMTWGVGDLFFISDVFPKDWESFFSGRPMEYLKLGVDGLKTHYASSLINAEVVVAPFFTPDQFPSPQRFFYFDPFAALPNQNLETPDVHYANTEIFGRLYRQVLHFDLSIYAYRGFWHTPSAVLDDPASPTTATRFYPKLSVYSASLQRGLFSGVISLEGGYYDSSQDRSGDDPTRPNGQWRFLSGYQQQLWEDFTTSVQFYGEYMHKYEAYRDSLPEGVPVQDEFRGVVSLRLTQFLHYQTWKLGFFGAYSPTDNDYFLQPEISYKMTDQLGISLGANLFGGESETTFFGQFDKSDDVYLNGRFDF